MATIKAKHMKSIKEKSEEYGLQYPVIHYDENGNTHNDVDKPSVDFEAGANYVLEAIIECLPKTSAYNPNEVIDIIVGKIKQLKEK